MEGLLDSVGITAENFVEIELLMTSKGSRDENLFANKNTSVLLSLLHACNIKGYYWEKHSGHQKELPKGQNKSFYSKTLNIWKRNNQCGI